MMTDASSNNVVDLRTGKPIEPPKNKPRKSKSADSATTSGKEAHKWEFKPRFRRHAFGWKSQPAITRIKQAVSEIKKVARQDCTVAAEGAVVFFERLAPAIEHVDGSSGSIGGAVNRSIEELVPIIAAARVDDAVREKWLARLWQAVQDDNMPYLELLGDHWGEICATRELASKWADDLIGIVRLCWSDDRPGSHFPGSTHCLSALLKAGRNDDLLKLLQLDRYNMWHYQKFGAQALANMGKISEAIEFAENVDNRYIDSSLWVARTCEHILLQAGRVEEAYERYAIAANRETTYVATYRAIAKKYPETSPTRILTDLIDDSPGEEGKWFATAKDLGFFELAVELARKGPCDPRTLTRAARDYAELNPEFALNVGMAALSWLIEGYGYEITGADVLAAFEPTMKAARAVGKEEQICRNLSEGVTNGLESNDLVAKILARELQQRQS